MLEKNVGSIREQKIILDHPIAHFIETREEIIFDQSKVNQDQFVHEGLYVKVCSGC